MPLPEDGGLSESAAYDSSPTFVPYDPPVAPESVQPTPVSPSPSSSTPGDGDTSGADGEPPEGEQQGQREEDPPEALPEFDKKHREDFTGLLYLGRLDKTFRLFGHTFVVRTLTTEQLAEVGLIHRPYIGSNAENAVYQSAVVAASVQTVDGESLPSSITLDASDDLVSVRFPYVMKNWMPAVREAVYAECIHLEILSRQVLSKMGKASG